MFGWIARGVGKAAGGVITSVGDAVNKNYKTIVGDKAEAETHIHAEQMATLAQFTAEFASRPPKTKWDSFVDGLNRLVRPTITFWILSLFFWPYLHIASFNRYMISLNFVPDEIWTLFLAITIFWFGGRALTQDIRKPKLTEEQKKEVLETIEKQEEKILEARTVLVVEAPATSKPPPPPWAQDILNKKPIPLPPKLPDDIVQPPIKGRPPEVEKLIENIIKVEGGFVNDPSDSGGATRYGITIATLSAWRECEVTVDDVKKLTKDEAMDIYRAEYYFKPSIDSLPMALQGHVLDCCINMGARGGVKLLQQAINALGGSIKVDGIIGPVTREQCAQCDHKQLTNTLVDHRIKFYEELAARRPKDRRFLKGWLLRANSFRIA